MFGFFNDGGSLSTTPGWQSAESSLQNFLAFGDYDGDGWADLAVSKWVNYESGIYRNVSGTMQTTPVWTTGDDDSDKGVAWADVDDDGWLDLALGHDPTRQYRNLDGTMSLVWESGASYHGHSDLRFHDFDRDGDPDLGEIHFSDGKTHLYLNTDGSLAVNPSWTYDSSAAGTAIAFGDVNGDGWDDLAIGYSGQPCVVVFLATPPDPDPDQNEDGLVDVDDYEVVSDCLTGPEVEPLSGCAYSDMNLDNDVDLEDMMLLFNAFTP
jgi:hypothetical protein